MNSPVRYFTALDSMRGLACVLVAIFHFSPTFGGAILLDFFLALSGFILSHMYLYGKEGMGIRQFMSHRIARMYPLQLYTLLVFAAGFYYMHGQFPVYDDGTWFTFFQHLTLTHNVGLNPNGVTWNEPAWSISVEFWVNVLFILFVTRKTPTWLLLVISFSGLTLIYYQSGHTHVAPENYFGFLNAGMVRGISYFMLGIVCYRIFVRFEAQGKSVRFCNTVEISVFLLLAIIMFGRSGIAARSDFLGPFLFLLFIPVLGLEKGWISQQVMKLKYIGTISYSFYLNHEIILRLSRHFMDMYDPGDIRVLVVFLVVVFAYSHLTYQFVERPSRRKLRNLFSRGKQERPEKAEAGSK